MAVQAQLCTDSVGGIGGGGGFLTPPNTFPDWNWNLLLENHNPLSCLPPSTTPLQHQMHHQAPLLFPPDLDSLSSSHSQCQEIDRFIASQNERLRLLLQEQRKRQTVGLLKRIEAKTSVLMKQKNEEILKAATKSAELEILLKRLEMESQEWQRAAQEKEAMVVSLNNTLEEMRERASCCLVINNGADDARSCCPGNTIGGGGQARHQEVDREVEDGGCESSSSSSSMLCRNCRCRNSCVLFLPCRHLCACKGCDAFLDSCPVCKMPKKASIEALIS